jgi:AraC-like DNA-binding protein
MSTSKPKIIVLSPQISDCVCWGRLFNTEFEAKAVRTETDFIKKARQESTDAAIICICSSPENEIDNIIRLETLSGIKPLLTCSKSLNPDFVKNAAVNGVNRFLLYNMDKEAIQDIILEAIKHGGLKKFLETYYGEKLSLSLHTGKLVDEIIKGFPHRPAANTITEKLDISRSWLHHICQEAFGKSFSRLLRLIWVHQALRMMKYTPLDNTQIALHLNYSEESSLARDFRKELACNPNKARQLLAQTTPTELLLKK